MSGGGSSSSKLRMKMVMPMPPHPPASACLFKSPTTTTTTTTTINNTIATTRGNNSKLLTTSPSPSSLCKVQWSIEADIPHDQLVYITGDPIALGCWNPQLAIPMFPTITTASGDHHLQLWTTQQLHLPSGLHFKYTFFIKHHHHHHSDDDQHLSWRPGPQHSLLTNNTNTIIHVRDRWMTTIPNIQTPLPHHLLWGSWLFLGNHATSNDIAATPTTEKLLSATDQPVEEPWLGSIKEETTNQLYFPHTNYHAKQEVSTLILINSSLCTMQRIAILEDNKLVELLLEPVKNNVHCDSVYLGVISKLAPNMGGAFVNIGISRPSLMDIKHAREPFVFPPFRQIPKGTDTNASVLPDSKRTNGDVDLVTDDEQMFSRVESLQLLNEDFEEHEFEDDFDVPDVSKRTVNDNVGCISDPENYTYRIGHHLDDFVPTETEASNNSQSSDHVLQNTKESVSVHPDESKWDYVRKGTKVIVQVVKEGLGTKGPTLTAYPILRSRFWILSTRCDRIGVSKKVAGVERTRLRVIAKTLQPPGFGLTVRTVAAGHSLEELQKDLEGLRSTWKSIIDHAKSAALAADEGVEGAVPVILHRAMGQTLSVAQDYFNEKVKGMVVDSPRTYHEITSYLQEIAPDLCDRVELYDKKIPIFDEYGIEEEINSMLSKTVPLANGGSLVIEQTEALVSIDVNGGHGMLGGHGNSQEKAILEVNLAAAKQIARELRLRDIGGIIVVDFIDMVDDSNKRLVYEEVKKAVERDRSTVRVSELSRHGLMEITRKRVRPSVTFMISEPCTCCHATGRVEALETSFSRIEHEICRLQAMSEKKADPGNPKSWAKLVLRVDRFMCNFLISGKRTRLALLSSSLKVWILLKVARGFSRGTFEVKPFTDGKESSYQNQVDISRLQPTKGRTFIPSTKLTLYPVNKWKTGLK